MAQHRDRQDREEHHKADHMSDPHPLVPCADGRCGQAVEPGGHRVPDEGVFLVVGHAVDGDAEPLCQETGEADGEQGAEDDGVLGLGLDANAVGALHVATQNRPDDAEGEHHTSEVANKGVCLVGAPMKELEAFGHLVIDLEHRGHAHQH